jgi:hypothetical protein
VRTPINFGKLGYLAAYSLEEFVEHLDLIGEDLALVVQRDPLGSAEHRAVGVRHAEAAKP